MLSLPFNHGNVQLDLKQQHPSFHSHTTVIGQTMGSRDTNYLERDIWKMAGQGSEMPCTKALAEEWWTYRRTIHKYKFQQHLSATTAATKTQHLHGRSTTDLSTGGLSIHRVWLQCHRVPLAMIKGCYGTLFHPLETDANWSHLDASRADLDGYSSRKKKRME